MDTEVISLAKMKTEAGRNLDADVNATTLIAGEKADGTFGVFNFFQGIKNFFKGISALGTLASGSRLPVTDSNGNVTYTTMNDINSYVINNALTNYEKVFKKTTNGEGTQIVSEAFNALGLNDNKTHTIMMKVENENTNGYILALITYNSNRLSNVMQKTVANNLIYINAVNYVGTIALAGYPESGNVKNNWTFWT